MLGRRASSWLLFLRNNLSRILILVAIVMAGVMLYMALYMPSNLQQYAAFLSFLFLLLILGIMFTKFEEAEISSKEVALIGILAAITAASRIPFAALPNIKPCTFLIIATGTVFGPLAGGMVGAMTALISNFFFGQGPWTAWEMVAWGMVGVVSGYISKRFLSEVNWWHLVLLGIVLGLAYNTLMDFSSWITFYRADASLFIPTFVAGIPFGALHILGNVIFALVLGKPVLMLFKRFQRRSHVSYEAEKGTKRKGASGGVDGLQ